jgi:DNA primase
MDAVTFLNKHIKIELLLRHYDFDRIHEDGDMIRACCKIHGGNNPTAFVVNTENGLWYCHTGGCGGGDTYTLVQRMEGIDFFSSIKWIADFFDVDIANLILLERQANYVKELSKFLSLMRDNKKRIFAPFTIEEEIREVTKFRNFQLETLQYFQLGFVETVTLTNRTGNTYTLHNRLAFPIFYDSVQIGISFRRTKVADVPKWSHQPVKLGAGNILYNYDMVQGSPIVVVCEGITDVWAYHEISVPAVATLGAHITHQQYKLLMKTGADIILSFDGDPAGREATEKAVVLLQNKANLSLIDFAEGEDPESIDRKELKHKIDHKRRLI